MIAIHDGVLADPQAYRQAALAQPFQSVPLGEQTFHGIAPPPSTDVIDWFLDAYPGYVPTLTFLRKSPAGQVEPNDIHSDAGMGDLTALLYLNPDPPVQDGTTFWRHRQSGSCTDTAWEVDGHDRAAWTPMQTVRSKFNRAVVFSAPLAHSRAVVENYGSGDDARLVQVLFARLRE